VRSKLREFLDRWSEVLRSTIEEAKAAGEMNGGLDTEQLVFELTGLYLSHHFWQWSMKDRAALSRTKTAFERLLAGAKA
jgi:hypothetical protein